MARLLLLFGCFLLLRCAVPGTITGGPRDETPPVLQPEESTANFQTNFRPTLLEFTYDEWLQLKNVRDQVIISPPVEPAPEITLRKKTVRVDFSEVDSLRQNATYTVNFGEAVQDLNEGNPADLRFVFSTGPFLDSLEVRARVLDGEDGKPVENALVMLYENTADSVVYTEAPFYFARTDKQGNARIRNVRAGTFKMVALEDGARVDYRYAPRQRERFAFLDTLIQTPVDSSQTFEFRLFTAADPFARTELIQERYGQIDLVFNQPPDSLRLGYEDRGQYFRQEQRGDTLRVWYDFPDGPPADRWAMYVPLPNRTDTIQTKRFDRAEFLANSGLRITGRANLISQNPDRPLTLRFNQPLAALDTSLFRILVDSTERRVPPVGVRLDSVYATDLVFDLNWRPGAPYSIVLLPGALTDRFGQTLADTTRRPVEVLTRDRFGTLDLTVTDLDSTKQYFLNVTGGKTVVDAFPVRGKTEIARRYPALPKGTYTLEIIEDTNGNRRWDTGNYDERLQPERRFSRDLEAIREDWEVEATVRLDFSPPAPVAPPSQPEGGRPRRQ